ncbi:MAG: beta-lactamase family protein [Archangiaceae bacterium]|nr:beta-lactamase family protein [Archangiaceae bacterium]
MRLRLAMLVALSACPARAPVTGDTAGGGAAGGSGGAAGGAVTDAGGQGFDAGIEGRAARDVSAELEAVRVDAGLIGVAVLEWRHGVVVFEGAAGTRRQGSGEAVQLGDDWELASCAKAISATVAAIAIERGELRWDTTLGEVFADGGVHPQLAAVTLEQLLEHRGGLVRDFSDATVSALSGTGRQQREAALQTVLHAAPATAVGEYAYSNVGYVVMAAMLERQAGPDFETQLQERLFAPLQMKCGFGLPHGPGGVQPWGHWLLGGGSYQVSTADDPLVYSAAGGLHCTLRDWAKVVAMHLRGERGEETLISAATMRRLHTPPDGGTYAAGWQVLQRSWAHGLALNHSGAYGGYQTLVWAAPNIETFTLTATNQQDPGGVTHRGLDTTSVWSGAQPE